MKMNRLTLILFGILISNSILSQENNTEYIKFIKNGIEFQTNGKDTICIVDPMPEFPGGNKKLIKFLQKNIKYPESAVIDKIEGKVVLRFTIDKSGIIRDIVVIESVREDLDNEAIRVIKKMPKWKPGEQNGISISVSYTYPIVFRL